MSETMILILSGFGLFVLGIVVGAVFHRSFQGEASKNRRLEQKISELQDHHTRYQADVSAHFMETARLVQTLNKSYRDVHAQLAKGASRLCDDEQADDFLSISFSSGKAAASNDKLTQEDDVYVPPMDYAPKEEPNAEGMLSERFGLNEKEAEEELAQDPAEPSQATSPPPKV